MILILIPFPPTHGLLMSCAALALLSASIRERTHTCIATTIDMEHWKRHAMSRQVKSCYWISYNGVELLRLSSLHIPLALSLSDGPSNEVHGPWTIALHMSIL